MARCTSAAPATSPPACTSTRSAWGRDTRRPVELVWHEEYENVGLAYSREKQVQNWGRAKRLALIEHDYESLPGLAKKDFGRRRLPAE